MSTQRELKFRAWILPREDHNGMDVGGEMWQWDGFQTLSPNQWRSDMMVVMQFTGLKDRNGKDIYEGDIVKVSGYQNPLSGEIENDLCVVEYEGPSLMYVDVDRSDSSSVESIIGVCSQDEDAEVVGNIHEHPELLKP